MIPNHSPWIKQLNRTRPVVSLDQDEEADVVIVGGGIAGVTTAFFTLRNTKKRVILIEADKVAHGATGHNAGQITSYFERPLSELVEEFGLECAIDGQQSIESAWVLLEEIVAEAKLQTPFYRFTGYAGLSTLEQLHEHLKNNLFRLQGGMQTESIVVAKEWGGIMQIDPRYNDLYTVAGHADIMGLLETKNPQFIAALAYQKGCMNSALFTEELIGFLLATYQERFAFYEGSPVSIVHLYEEYGVVDVKEHVVFGRTIILCTNGFAYFKIENHAGPEIDTKFHHSVVGRIGYMSGYMEPLNHPPTAISYFPRTKLQNNDPTGDSYFYVTRRPHEHEGKTAHNLVCTGGPEKVLPSGAQYERGDSCSEDVRTTIDDFLHDNFGKYPGGETEYPFCWHGLMGYTPNGIRRVGVEPCNQVLMYNLGCNGVGILPSIFGSNRISKILNKEPLAPSIFDPLDQRCELAK